MKADRLFTCLIGSLFMCASVFTQASISPRQITFTWDPTPSPDYLISRYEFIVTTNLAPIQFTNNPPINWLYVVTGRTNTTITISNLPPGCWTAQVRVIDTNGIASDLSNQIIFLVPPAPSLRIQASVEAADDPTGPWVELVRHPIDVIADGGKKFFRSVTYIERL